MKSRSEFSANIEYSEYLRAHFAGLAMQAILSNVELLKSKKFDERNVGRTMAEVVVEDCVVYADELLKQLENHPDNVVIK